MRVIENKSYSRRTAIGARIVRTGRFVVSRSIDALLSIFAQAFPLQLPHEPLEPPPIAKADALREGALLAEDLDAFSRKHVA